MIAHPKRTVKIRLGRMEGESPQFVEKSVGQKSQRGRQSQGDAARFYSAKSFLDEDTGQDVGWFLHGDYKVLQMRRVHLDSSPERKVAWSAAFTPLPHRQPMNQSCYSNPLDRK